MRRGTLTPNRNCWWARHFANGDGAEPDRVAGAGYSGRVNAVRKERRLWCWLHCSKEAGDIRVAQERLEQSRECYLKGLHSSPDALREGESASNSRFVPRVEMFHTALADEMLPLHKQPSPTQHYQRTGQFAKADAACFTG